MVKRRGWLVRIERSVCGTVSSLSERPWAWPIEGQRERWRYRPGASDRSFRSKDSRHSSPSDGTDRRQKRRCFALHRRRHGNSYRGRKILTAVGNLVVSKKITIFLLPTSNESIGLRKNYRSWPTLPGQRFSIENSLLSFLISVLSTLKNQIAKKAAKLMISSFLLTSYHCSSIFRVFFPSIHFFLYVISVGIARVKIAKKKKTLKLLILRVFASNSKLLRNLSLFCLRATTVRVFSEYLFFVVVFHKVVGESLYYKHAVFFGIGRQYYFYIKKNDLTSTSKKPNVCTKIKNNLLFDTSDRNLHFSCVYHRARRQLIHRCLLRPVLVCSILLWVFDRPLLSLPVESSKSVSTWTSFSYSCSDFLEDRAADSWSPE